MEPHIEMTPPTTQSASGDDPECPACGHPATATSSPVLTWLAHRLGRTPPRARCAYMESSAESGVGLPGPCGCRDAFHGS